MYICVWNCGPQFLEICHLIITIKKENSKGYEYDIITRNENLRNNNGIGTWKFTLTFKPYENAEVYIYIYIQVCFLCLVLLLVVNCDNESEVVKTETINFGVTRLQVLLHSVFIWSYKSPKLLHVFQHKFSSLILQFEYWTEVFIQTNS